MSTFWKVVIAAVIIVVAFALGYYMGIREEPDYDVEGLFASGLQDGEMIVYRGDASPMRVAVEIGDQTDESLRAVVTVTDSGAKYGLSAFQRRTVIEDDEGRQLAAAAWDDSTLRVSLLDAGGNTVATNPLGGKLLLQSAHQAALDPDALALLDGSFVNAVLEAAGNWTLLNRHRTNPLILLTESNDLPEEVTEAIATTLIEGKLDSIELIDYHHDVLNHGIPREFFEGHKTIIAEITEWLRQQTIDGEPLGLPFGRLPYWDPGLPIVKPFGAYAPIADSILAEFPMCSHFRARVGIPERYFLVNQPSNEITHWWPCDPAEAATWCDKHVICEGDPHPNADDPVGACGQIPDGECPFSIITPFKGENICEFSSLETFYVALLDWHSDTHVRAGGAMGNHPLTPATPVFWAFHQQIDALYDNWSSCS